MQKGFIKDSNKHLLDKINSYIETNTFDNIFFTKCVNDKNSPYSKILDWKGMLNSDEQEILITIPQQAQILTKNCYGLSFSDIKSFK